MADELHNDYLTNQCDELILQILYWLDGSTVVRLSKTCRKLYRICSFDRQLWSRLCFDDFGVKLPSPQPFSSFQYLYKLLYQSREVLKVYLSDSYQNFGNNRYGVLPGWLWTWVVFNTSPPFLPNWIRNYHEPLLRYKLDEISLGKVLRVWNLKASDLPEHMVVRVEYGTSYYRWRDIQIAAMRAHGGQRELERFLLKRCSRSRGYVERAFERIRKRTFMVDSRARYVEVGESSQHNGQSSSYRGESSQHNGQSSSYRGESSQHNGQSSSYRGESSSYYEQSARNDGENSSHVEDSSSQGVEQPGHGRMSLAQNVLFSSNSSLNSVDESVQFQME